MHNLDIAGKVNIHALLLKFMYWHLTLTNGEPPSKTFHWICIQLHWMDTNGFLP